MMHPRKKSIIRVTAAIVAASFMLTQCGIGTAFALRTQEPAGTGVADAMGVDLGQNTTVSTTAAKGNNTKIDIHEKAGYISLMAFHMSDSVALEDRNNFARIIVDTVLKYNFNGAVDIDHVLSQISTEFVAKKFLFPIFDIPNIPYIERIKNNNSILVNDLTRYLDANAETLTQAQPVTTRQPVEFTIPRDARTTGIQLKFEQQLAKANAGGTSLFDKPIEHIKTLLIVEDTETFRKMMKLLLNNLGIQVIFAENLDDFKSIWAEKSAEIDAVLTDTGMENMYDGFEVVKIVNPDPREKNVPVIIWTATRSEDLTPIHRNSYQQMKDAGAILYDTRKDEHMLDNFKTVVYDLDAAVGKNTQASAIGEFIRESSGQIIAAFRENDPTKKLETLLPQIVQRAEADYPNQDAAAKALKTAFDSIQGDASKRVFTSLVGRVITNDLNELGDDINTEDFPRILPGHGTVWTLTTSPTIDVDAKNKLRNWDDPKGFIVNPGGGGINVAIALARRGVRARPVFFYAGRTGELLLKLIRNQAVHTGDAIKLTGDEETRMPIVTSLDKADSLMPKGTPVDETAQEDLLRKMLDENDGVKKGDIVVFSGSLAPGLPDTFYADLGKKLMERGATVIIDTKGSPAKAVLAQHAATVYSQNHLEFGEITGTDPNDTAALIKKAREIIESQPPDQGIQEIVITSGPKGAFSVTRDRIWEAPAPEVKSVSEIGAGDTSLAERVFRLWQGEEPNEAFKYGVAAGTASVTHAGTGGGTLAETEHFADRIPMQEHVLAENPFLRGSLPPANLVRDGRIATQTTSKIAAGVYSRRLIGEFNRLVGLGVPIELALRYAEADLDLLGQDVFNELHEILRARIHLMGYEGRKKRGSAGLLRAGRVLGVSNAKSEVYGIVDVVEGSQLVINGKQDPSGSGGSSLYLTGPLVRAFGPVPDELGAGLVIIGISPEHRREMDRFLPSRGGKPLDPDAPVLETLRTATEVNHAGFDDLDVYIMNRNRLNEEYLNPIRALQQAHPGLRIIEINLGSHDQALKTILGQKDSKRIPVFLGTSGSTEAVADYLHALLFDSVAVGLRLYGDYSKTIGDEAGSLAKTLSQITEEQRITLRQIIPDFDKLPQDVPIRYLFSPKLIHTLKDELCREDADAIISPRGRLFHNQSLAYPKVETDTPGIVLRNERGDTIRLVPNIKWDDPILTASTSFLLDSTTLGIPGVSEQYQGYYSVPTLIVERTNGNTYVWVHPINVKHESLTELLPQHFPPLQTEASAAGEFTPKQWNQIINSPEQTGFAEWIKTIFPTQEGINRNLALFRQLTETAQTNNITAPSIIEWAPGRYRVYAGHTDAKRFEGWTINAAIDYGIRVLIAKRDDGTVRALNTDPQTYPNAHFETSNPEANVTPGMDWTPWTTKIIEEKKQALRTALAQRKKTTPDQITQKELDAEWESGRDKRWYEFIMGAYAYIMKTYGDRTTVSGKPLKDEMVNGFDIVVCGDLPQGGFSSSSAINTALTRAISDIYGLNLSDEEIVNAGKIEQYTGIQFGLADEMAIVHGKLREVSLGSTEPYEIVQAVNFPQELKVVYAYTGFNRADNSTDTINRTSAMSELGAMWLIHNYPNLEQLRKGLRELVKGELRDSNSITLADVYRMVKKIPLKITREELLRSMPEFEKEMKAIFARHNDPGLEGYNLRAAIVYLLAENARVWRYMDAVEKADIEAVLNLVRASNDGDRITTYNPETGRYTKWDPNTGITADRDLDRLIDICEHPENYRSDEIESAKLEWQHGSFERNTELIDELIDTVNKETGEVVAGRIQAAGGGGFVTFHVWDTDGKQVERLKTALEKFYAKHGLTENYRKLGLDSNFIEPVPTQGACQVKGNFTAAAATGTLVEGRDYQIVGGDVAEFMVSIKIDQPERLSNGAVLDPTNIGEIEGASIIIAKGARLFSDAKLRGPVIVNEGATVGGFIGGTTKSPTVIDKNAKIMGSSSNITSSIVGAGARLTNTDITGAVLTPITANNETAPVRIATGSIVEKGSVLIGATVGTNVKLRRNCAVGPHVSIDNGSEHKAITFFGITEDAGIAFPHSGYMGSIWSMPILIDPKTPLYSEVYYSTLKNAMRAVLFGTLKSTKTIEKGPISSTGATYEYTYELEGQEITFCAQRINFGAGVTTSDYNPLTGVKSGGIVEGGVAMGVKSVVKSPAVLTNSVLVGNQSKVEGMIPMGTIIGGNDNSFMLPGYRLRGGGFIFGDKISHDITVEFDYFRRLMITAQIFAEAARKAQDPITLAGFSAATKAVAEQFAELAPRYLKLLQAFDKSLANLAKEKNKLISDIFGSQTWTNEQEAGLIKRVLEEETRNKAEERLKRVILRIQEQEGIVAEKDKLISDLDTMTQTIDSLTASLEYTVTQQVIADSVENQILNPAYTWQNPLQPATAAALGTTGTFRPEALTKTNLEAYTERIQRDGMLPNSLEEGGYGESRWYNRINQLRLALSLLTRVNDADSAANAFLNKAEQIENGRHAQYVSTLRVMAKIINDFRKSFTDSQFREAKAIENPKEGSILSIGLTTQTGLSILAGRVNGLPVILLTRTNEERNLLLANFTYTEENNIPINCIITLEENGNDLNKTIQAAAQRLKELYPTITTARYYFAEESETSLQKLGLTDTTVAETNLAERAVTAQEIDFMRENILKMLQEMGTNGLSNITDKDKDAYDKATALVTSL